jgi:alpha-glucosidase
MKQTILMCMILANISMAAATEVVSPDGKISISIDVNNSISYSVSYAGKNVILSSPISVTLEKQGELGKNPKLIKTVTHKQDQILQPVVPVKSKTIKDSYNEAVLYFEGAYSISFRAYDDGIAYRFITDINDSIKVVSEQVSYNLPENLKTYYPEESNYVSHNECYYDYNDVKAVEGKQCVLPLLLEIPNGPKLLITEADIQDYPGLYLYASNGSFIGRHPGRVLEYSMDKRYLKSVIKKRAGYIAETNGKRAFPWRVVVIAANDSDLLLSELIYKLAKPQAIEDTSWIKPGKVAWDWYNANNIYGVDFRAGINTDTYKYYIDFASKYKLEYVIFDEGWYVGKDVLGINPEMNMEELFAYAKSKNVGIILWVGWKAFDDKFDEAMQQFETWGAAGIKIDFMMRDDQDMVNFFYKVAREAARRRMLVDYHGSYKPDGLSRTYPNVLTREGLKGLENNKWDVRLTPEHCVTLPFTRMVAGPMDFTPGAMRNAGEKDFNAVFNCPMSQGTRCMQLAMYVIYESPLQMLADSPSHYLRESEIMDYLSKVPTTWDETKVLQAKVADYVVMARRKGNDWFIGAMTDGAKREFDIDLSFLKDGNYQADIYQDGVNADRYAEDYKRIKTAVTSKDNLKIRLAPGGGYAAIITNLTKD